MTNVYAVPPYAPQSPSGAQARRLLERIGLRERGRRIEELVVIRAAVA
jgi:hypothetical protein